MISGIHDNKILNIKTKRFPQLRKLNNNELTQNNGNNGNVQGGSKEYKGTRRFPKRPYGPTC